MQCYQYIDERAFVHVSQQQSGWKCCICSRCVSFLFHPEPELVRKGGNFSSHGDEAAGLFFGLSRLVPLRRIFGYTLLFGVNKTDERRRRTAGCGRVCFVSCHVYIYSDVDVSPSIIMGLISVGPASLLIQSPYRYLYVQCSRFIYLAATYLCT